jgi:hypothetical protein
MKERQMILKLESETSGRQVQIIISEEITCDEIMGEIRGLLIAWGYHPYSVIEACKYIIDEYEEKKKD